MKVAVNDADVEATLARWKAKREAKVDTTPKSVVTTRVVVEPTSHVGLLHAEVLELREKVIHLRHENEELRLQLVGIRDKKAAAMKRYRAKKNGG